MISSRAHAFAVLPLAFAALSAVAPAAAQTLGSDAAACAAGGPAIRVNVFGLKDRTGELKVELYPPNATDFLRDDRELVREGKLFRRVTIVTPGAGPVAICIRVPSPGRYALLVTHNRDGHNKFSIWSDGAGLPSNVRLGRSRPQLAQARRRHRQHHDAVSARLQRVRPDARQLNRARRCASSTSMNSTRRPVAAYAPISIARWRSWPSSVTN